MRMTYLTMFLFLSTMFLFSSCGHDDDISDNSDVYLTCPDSNHPHKIDLALPSGTKWACCNIGANFPAEYGGHYGWGEMEPKEKYNWETYALYDNENDSYVLSGNDIAGTQYDVAHVKWGGSWQMPSVYQFRELCNNCSWSWTEQNGVNGLLVSGLNGGAIFLPAAGILWNNEYGYGGHKHNGEEGFYWSSTLYPNDEEYAYYLHSGSEGEGWEHYYLRVYGLTVRAVCP